MTQRLQQLPKRRSAVGSAAVNKPHGVDKSDGKSALAEVKFFLINVIKIVNVVLCLSIMLCKESLLRATAQNGALIVTGKCNMLLNSY